MKKILLVLCLLVEMGPPAIADEPGYFTLGKSKLGSSAALAPSYFTLGKSKLDGGDVLAPGYFTLDKSNLDGSDVLAPSSVTNKSATFIDKNSSQ